MGKGARAGIRLRAAEQFRKILGSHHCSRDIQESSLFEAQGQRFAIPGGVRGRVGVLADGIVEHVVQTQSARAGQLQAHRAIQVPQRRRRPGLAVQQHACRSPAAQLHPPSHSPSVEESSESVEGDQPRARM